MALIKLGATDQLLLDLKRAQKAGQGVRCDVRWDHLTKPVPGEYAMQVLVAVATAIVDSDIWRMEKTCGVVWDWDDEVSFLARKQLKEIHQELEEGCKELGLELLDGTFEEV